MHWKHSIKHSYHPGGSKYLDQDTNIMSSSFCWCFRVCHANTSVWIDLLARAGVGVSYASLSEDKNILSYQQQRVKWHVNSTLSRWGEVGIPDKLSADTKQAPRPIKIWFHWINLLSMHQVSSPTLLVLDRSISKSFVLLI